MLGLEYALYHSLTAGVNNEALGLVGCQASCQCQPSLQLMRIFVLLEEICLWCIVFELTEQLDLCVPYNTKAMSYTLSYRASKELANSLLFSPSNLV